MLELIRDEERLSHKFDDGTDEKPIFYYRRLKGSRSQKINLDNTKLTKNGPITYTDAILNETLTQGLLGWDNVKLNGEEVEYSPSLIPKLPMDCKMELAGKIAADSEINEEEEKNS